MSLATLTEDLVGILREMFPIPTRSDAAAKVDESVKIILVGHSMVRPPCSPTLSSPE